ncbi:MAG: rod shape-determining protein RodA [Parcubacteria group bacterium]|nr:rod shape-determining protein RodA [Parcubacteria group bacterium]
MPWFLKKVDWWFLGSVLTLAALSVVTLISLGSRAQEPFFWVWRQVAWVLIGLALFGLTSALDYRIFRNSGAVVTGFYGVTLLLLVAVLFWGKTIRGSRGWFELGAFTLQPVEFMKVALLVFLAKYFASKNIEIWQFRHIAVSAFWTVVPVVLLIMQPDWGSATVLVALWFCMVLVSGARKRHITLLVLLLMLVSVVAWIVALTPSQKGRILTLIRPSLDPHGISYSQRQAVVAVGSGGLWGKGLGQGTQAQLKFLPEPRTDFIFAAIAEELGAVGALFVLLCYGLIFFRVSSMVGAFENNFARLFGVGVLVLFGLHVMVNVGMNLGVFPVVGLTLPFLSYGGSSTLANFILAGILMSMKFRIR